MCMHYLFFFNDTATTEIYTLSLHDALPISEPAASSTCRRRSTGSAARRRSATAHTARAAPARVTRSGTSMRSPRSRSEEHTSELQSRQYLVCRLLLEKKKKHEHSHTSSITP